MANVVNSFNLHGPLQVHFVEESSTPWIWDGYKSEYCATEPKLVAKILAHGITEYIMKDVHKARQLMSAMNVLRNHI